MRDCDSALFRLCRLFDLELQQAPIKVSDNTSTTSTPPDSLARHLQQSLNVNNSSNTATAASTVDDSPHSTPPLIQPKDLHSGEIALPRETYRGISRESEVQTPGGSGSAVGTPGSGAGGGLATGMATGGATTAYPTGTGSETPNLAFPFPSCQYPVLACRGGQDGRAVALIYVAFSFS